ncbi:MAG TPA: ubiquitin-like small modifier protein 1 [Candidatus Eisenbacteria bacterium]|nr:ubiquitin-like small modifier protein 1 [Candidatus Eisenbacteria bacterium]
MAVTVHIPGALREHTQGADRVRVPARAATVHDALASLWAMHPGVRDRVVDERGAVRQHVNVFVGDESIRWTGGLATPVRDGDELWIVPAVSGG